MPAEVIHGDEVDSDRETLWVDRLSDPLLTGHDPALMELGFAFEVSC